MVQVSVVDATSGQPIGRFPFHRVPSRGEVIHTGGSKVVIVSRVMHGWVRGEPVAAVHVRPPTRQGAGQPDFQEPPSSQ